MGMVITPPPIRKCDACGLPPRPNQRRLLRCARCGRARYHDERCQRDHYPKHRAECRRSVAVSASGAAADDEKFVAAAAAAADGVDPVRMDRVFAGTSAGPSPSAYTGEEGAPSGEKGGDDDDRRRFHPSFVACDDDCDDFKRTIIREVAGHISREDLHRLLVAGECFVWRDGGLMSGDGKWTFDYLEANLPADERYGGMIADVDDDRIFRYHGSGVGGSGKDSGASEQGAKGRDDGGGGGSSGNSNSSKDAGSRRSSFTFREFCSEPHAYMQMPLLWRDDIHCNGFKGPIGDVLWNDLRSELVNFRLLSQLRVEPTVYSPLRVLQLFASRRDHLSYLHFDEQPNLFMQVSGKKRWLLFSPGVGLRPYGPRSVRGGARRSSVDVFVEAGGDLRGRGAEALLGPGDVLFVPPYWWHHVHTVTEECVSIAAWFFDERLPLPGGTAPTDEKYPVPLELTKEQLLARKRYRCSSV